ncbi:response regulator [bacterium]|nr:response regulator [bacterium]
MGNKILVVDDVKSMRELIGATLEDAGFNVSLADSARTFLWKLNEVEYDLVLLDVNLPDLSGISALEKINTIHPDKSPKVIFISGETDATVVHSAIQAGAEEYLCKPIDSDLLLLKVKKALNICANSTFAKVRCELTYDYSGVPIVSRDSIIELSETACTLETISEFDSNGLFEISVPFFDLIVKEKNTLRLKIDGVRRHKERYLVNCDFIGLSASVRKAIRSIVVKGDAIAD